MLKPKSSKKSKKIKIRKRWKINPRTKVEESAKRYRRSREKAALRKRLKNEIEKKGT